MFTLPSGARLGPRAPGRWRSRHLECEALENRWLLSVTPAPLIGDANNDGVVNGLDISAVASHWLQRDDGSLLGDANGDGVVNGLDIAAIAAHWGQTPVTAVGPQIQLDATNTSTVSTALGGAQFNAAQQQYLTEPDNLALDGTFNNAQHLTIEFQVKQTTLGLDRNFVTRWDANSTGSIAITTGPHSGQTGELAVWFAGPNGSEQGRVITSGANLLAGRVYDIAVVYDGTQAAAANRVAVYIDGVQAQTYIDSGSVPASLTPSTAALDLGRWNGWGRYLDGTMQNVNIWIVAKTQAQIQSLQNDTLTYSQFSPDQMNGLVQSFALTENGGPSSDAVSGYVMQNPTGIVREQYVTQWTGAGTLPTVFTPSPEGSPPDYVAHSPLNGQQALKFNGLSDALKYASNELPDEQSGDVFIVAQFTGSGDDFEGDTLFSSSSDTTAVDYFFMASFNAGDVGPAQGGGAPRVRLRFRDDAFQTDLRSGATTLVPNVTYVLHFWGLGTGQGYGLTINGLDQGPFFTTSTPTDYASAAGSWFGAVPNRTNLTIGDFERSDGPQGFAAAYISEIDVYAGTPAQPVLSPEVSASIVDYLMTKYGATPLGSDG